ncbi:MAG TPA: TIGR01777 family oxidoreductase [Roseimicrobium sp.]|nr:TIGR01777 family oxidoreductase [Roseimicrobium sp.]
MNSSSDNEQITFQSHILAPADAVYDWHARPGALERLTPPWEKVQIVEKTGGLENGSRVTLETRFGPFATRWVAEHHDCVINDHFRDRQISGPFKSWDHLHRFRSDGTQASVLEDQIRFTLPLGKLGKLFGLHYTRQRLKRMFLYRHATTAADVRLHLEYENRPRLRIAISGASGMVGTSLTHFLTTGGHTVIPIVRKRGTREEILWNPTDGTIDRERLSGCDAVIHLAGDNIAGGRWTTEKKARIRNSRVDTTALLAKTLASMQRGPRTLICASAIGIYGDQGDRMLDETSPKGDGFLADVGEAWESAAAPAMTAGLRVVFTRFGIILTPAGGALQKMLPPFLAGAGGAVGSGRQYWSWVSIEDVLGILHFALMEERISGPVNTVAPHSVTNREFTEALARVLHRPALLPLPASLAKLAFGEMAEATLLASTRVQPAALQQLGYRFRHPDLAAALEFLLGRAA